MGKNRVLIKIHTYGFTRWIGQKSWLVLNCHSRTAAARRFLGPSVAVPQRPQTSLIPHIGLINVHYWGLHQQGWIQRLISPGYKGTGDFSWPPLAVLHPVVPQRCSKRENWISYGCKRSWGNKYPRGVWTRGCTKKKG